VIVNSIIVALRAVDVYSNIAVDSYSVLGLLVKAILMLLLVKTGPRS
jgi:hypothetical protein